MQAFAQQMGERVTLISQKNIGASLRSTPATYLGVADEIRALFAKASGQKIGLFSFNGAGACPVCQGKGVIVSEMALWIPWKWCAKPAGAALFLQGASIQAGRTQHLSGDGPHHSAGHAAVCRDSN